MAKTAPEYESIGESMEKLQKLRRGVTALLSLLILIISIFETATVNAGIKEADVFLDSNWTYAGESTPFADGGWLQAICDTENYIIGVENASNTNSDPDTLVAFYKNNYDENGNPVQQFSYAKHVTQMDYEHCNGMTYDPVDKRILIAGGKALNKENTGCIFIVDSETLGYIEKVKIAEKGRVSAVDYWEKNDQFVFLIGVTQTSFKFVITDRDFNVLDEFAGVDSSAGNTFQDFCISGDYIISIPFMKRTAEDDTLQVYSLTEQRLVGTYGLWLEGEETYVEPESICEIAPGKLLIGSMQKDPNRVVFYTTQVAAAFSVRTDVANGTVTDSQQVLDQGTDFTVGYEPNENYELRKIYVDGEKQNILEYPTEYTFSNLQDDHEIDIVYTEIPKFPVVAKAQGGRVKAAEPYVRRGKDVSVWIKPYEHYELDWLMVDGEIVELEDGAKKYTFEKCQGPPKLYAYFKEKPVFEMKAEVLGGQMQVESKSVYRDDDYTVRYQPNENYEFAHLYIDGKEVTDLTNEQKESYTFSNVQESHSIRVEYRWKYLPYVLGGIGVILLVILIFAYIRFLRWLKRRRVSRQREAQKKDFPVQEGSAEPEKLADTLSQEELQEVLGELETLSKELTQEIESADGEVTSEENINTGAQTEPSEEENADVEQESERKEAAEEPAEEESAEKIRELEKEKAGELEQVSDTERGQKS